MKAGDKVQFNDQNAEFLRISGKNDTGEEIAEIRIDNRQFFVVASKLDGGEPDQQPEADGGKKPEKKSKKSEPTPENTDQQPEDVLA